MNATPRITPRAPGVLQGIILLMPCTLSVMGIAVLVPVIPQLMEQFAAIPNHAYLIQGGVLTMPALCIMLFSPLAGWLADRVGRRRLLIGAMLLYAAFGTAPTYLNDLFAIIATRVGVGLCEAVIMTTSTTLIGDYFKGAAREKWLASQTAVASLSALLIIYVGGLLGAQYGWRGPFGVYVFSLVLVVGVWWLTWEPESHEAVHAADSASAGAAEYTEFPWPRMIGICAITLLAALMFFVIQTQNSLALNVLGVRDPAEIGKLTMLASLGVPLGTIVFRLAARLPIGLLLMLEFAVISAGFFGMGQAADASSYVWAAGFNQVGCGMVLPTLLTWATRGLAFEIRGRGTGMWTGVFHIGQFLSGLVVTFLAVRAGGLLPVFTILGVTCGIAAALAIAGHLSSRWIGAETSAKSATRGPAAVRTR